MKRADDSELYHLRTGRRFGRAGLHSANAIFDIRRMRLECRCCVDLVGFYFPWMTRQPALDSLHP